MLTHLPSHHVPSSGLGGRRRPRSDKGACSAGLVWVLAQEVPRARGTVPREPPREFAAA